MLIGADADPVGRTGGVAGQREEVKEQRRRVGLRMRTDKLQELAGEPVRRVRAQRLRPRRFTATDGGGNGGNPLPPARLGGFLRSLHVRPGAVPGRLDLDGGELLIAQHARPAHAATRSLAPMSAASTRSREHDRHDMDTAPPSPASAMLSAPAIEHAGQVARQDHAPDGEQR